MNTPAQIQPRRIISIRMLEQQKDHDVPVLAPVKFGAVIRRLTNLHLAVEDQHRAVARDVADVLVAQGFRPQHLDDMVYEIADHVCGDLNSSSACDHEYHAANELNTKTMVDQLTILAVWFGSEAGLKSKLARDLLVSFSN